MKKTTPIILILLLTFLACSDKKHWTDGGYNVRRTAGAPDGMTLYYGDHGRVDKVIKIGFNSQFIVIESEGTTAENQRDYWILDKKEDEIGFNHDEIVEGPYTQASFKRRRKELGIIEIKLSEI